MGDNIYEPPKAEVNDDFVGGNPDLQEFYVVSIRKFLILFIMTLGIYSVYWFYKNWAQYKARHNDDMWPVMRGIFSIFFAHSLFNRVKITLEEKSQTHNWSPAGLATLYVVCSVLANITDRMSMNELGSPWTDIIGLVTIFGAGYALYKAQFAINLACDDPEGSSNSNITAANIVWIILGIIFWGLVLLGLATVLFGL